MIQKWRQTGNHRRSHTHTTTHTHTHTFNNIKSIRSEFLDLNALSVAQGLSLSLSPPHPPPYKYEVGGGYMESLRLYFLLSVCPSLSGQYLLNRSTISNPTWYCGVVSWGCVSCRKKRFIISDVKVTARAYIIKIWLFLLYLLNCWSVCDQTWINSTTS